MRVKPDTYVDHGGHEEGAPGCLRCHGKLETATGEPPTVISQDCTACHYLQAPSPIPAAETEPSGGDTAVTEPSDEGTAETPGAPTLTPHPIKGREDCLMCHGPGGFKPVADDHAGRTNDTCVGCHRVAE